MKLRNFSIRDILWLTLLVAILLAWWINHNTLVRKHQAELDKLTDFFAELEKERDINRGVMLQLQYQLKELERERKK
jgi:hypothetical protein